MFTQQFLHFLKHFYQIFGMKGRSTEKRRRRDYSTLFLSLKTLKSILTTTWMRFRRRWSDWFLITHQTLSKKYLRYKFWPLKITLQSKLGFFPNTNVLNNKVLDSLMNIMHFWVGDGIFTSLIIDLFWCVSTCFLMWIGNTLLSSNYRCYKCTNNYG